MAVCDIITCTNGIPCLSETIETNTTTEGIIIDTADDEIGLGFFFGITAYVAGQYVLNLEEGDDSGLSDAVNIPAEKLIGDKPILDAVTVGEFAKIGVFSNKRYVRASVISTGASEANGATVLVFAIQGPESC